MLTGIAVGGTLIRATVQRSISSSVSDGLGAWRSSYRHSGCHVQIRAAFNAIIDVNGLHSVVSSMRRDALKHYEESKYVLLAENSAS